MAEKVLTANTKWSFSRISAYSECPYGFYLKYMQDPPSPDQGNAWSDFGTLCHELLEEYAQGKIAVFDLADEYAARYNAAVVHNFPPFPKGYAEKTYEQGLAYFNQFDGFDEDKNEIVSAEEHFEIPIGPYTIIGISDLVLRNKETEALIVIDHKTKSPNSMKHDYPLYRNQLYIYAQHVYIKYGRYPSTLGFNMIKDVGASLYEPFDPAQMEATRKWVEDQIDAIYLEEDWEAKKAQEIYNGKGDFYCRYICPTFQFCEYAQDAIQSRSRR